MNALTPMMDTTMTPNWAIHPQPREGEMLESWIVRLSEANLVPNRWVLEALELGGIIGSFSNATVTSLESLSQSTGASFPRILESHLGSFGDRCGAAYTMPYVIPARTKAAEGVHFKLCPACLEADAVPHIRLRWALDITCFCPIHRAVLLERCPKCGGQFRLNTRQRKTRLHECANCGFDVRQSAVVSSDQFATAITFQQHVLELHRDDLVQVPGKRSSSGSSFAALVQRLFRRLHDLGLRITLESLDDSSFHETVLLLDDRFSARDRRANALSVIAWLMADPLPRWKILEPQLRQHPLPATGIVTHGAFRGAMQTLGITNASVREVNS